jgi:hypothetical protein
MIISESGNAKPPTECKVFNASTVMGSYALMILVGAPAAPCAPIYGSVPWASRRLLVPKLARIRKSDDFEEHYAS